MRCLSCEEALQKDSLSLALVGDAVWSLFVKNMLIRLYDSKSSVLSKKSVSFLCAKAQAVIFHFLEGKVSEKEKDIMLRARNAHHGQKAKNASIVEYKKATAFEALLGFLHLTGQEERLNEIQRESFNYIQNEKQ